MFNVGGSEIIVILLLALLLLGPEKLPDTARKVGKFLAEVRRVTSGF
ncbi:MAG: twin-arginine translocase TatA/TatE family subunit, partial [Actinomycetota bacterium]